MAAMTGRSSSASHGSSERGLTPHTSPLATRNGSVLRSAVSALTLVAVLLGSLAGPAAAQDQLTIHTPDYEFAEQVGAVGNTQDNWDRENESLTCRQAYTFTPHIEMQPRDWTLPKAPMPPKRPCAGVSMPEWSQSPGNWIILAVPLVTASLLFIANFGVFGGIGKGAGDKRTDRRRCPDLCADHASTEPIAMRRGGNGSRRCIDRCAARILPMRPHGGPRNLSVRHQHEPQHSRCWSDGFEHKSLFFKGWVDIIRDVGHIRERRNPQRVRPLRSESEMLPRQILSSIPFLFLAAAPALAESR